MEKYDVIIIGAGAAGSTAVELLNNAGLSVALVEKNALGGTCLNYGCDPTKTALRTAKIVHDAQNSGKYGLEIGDVGLNWWGLLDHIESVQNMMRGGTEEEARAQMRERGIDLIIGEGRFVSEHEVAVNGRILQADQIIIATGTRAFVPNIEGLQHTGFVTNKTIFQMPLQPQSLAVVGGGPIGVEFAQMFNRFGTKVRLIEASSHILPKDDEALASELESILIHEGIDVLTHASVTAARPADGGKQLTISYESGYQEEITVGEILVAVGRQAVFDTLDLNAAGVEAGDGRIEVNDALQTNVSHIWAPGDVSAVYQFTHVASRQGEHVAHNIINGEAKPFEKSPIPWVTYSDPELAHVGKTAVQLEAENIPFKTISSSFENNARAMTMGKTNGRIKLLVGEDDRILGGHVLATNGGELLGPIILAMKENIPATALAKTVWPYPTMSESLGKAAQELIRA